VVKHAGDHAQGQSQVALAHGPARVGNHQSERRRDGEADLGLQLAHGVHGRVQDPLGFTCQTGRDIPTGPLGLLDPLRGVLDQHRFGVGQIEGLLPLAEFVGPVVAHAAGDGLVMPTSQASVSMAQGW